MADKPKKRVGKTAKKVPGRGTVTKRSRAERELAEKEESLRKLSDNLPDGLVYQIDSGKDGQHRRFTYISKSVEQMHGVTAAEVFKDPQAIYGQVIEKDRAQIAEREAAALESRALTPPRLAAGIQSTLTEGG